MLLYDWKIPEPSIVISVTGGASDFRFDHKLKNAFTAGIIRRSAVNTHNGDVYFLILYRLGEDGV